MLYFSPNSLLTRLKKGKTSTSYLSPSWHATFVVASNLRSPEFGCITYAEGDIGWNINKQIIYLINVILLAANILFTIEDGWGFNEHGHKPTSVGAVEIRAWCRLGQLTQTAVMIGPDVANEQLEFPLPGLVSGGDMFVLVKVCT